MSAAKALSNFVTGGLSLLLVSVLGLVATPLLVKWLGGEVFGAYRAVFDWLGYLLLLELGVNEALFPLFSRSFSSAKSEVKNVAGAALRAHLKVVPIKLAVTFLLVLAIPYLVPVSDENRFDLQLATALFGIGGAILGPFQILRNLREAEQKGYINNALQTVQGLLIVIFSLVFARVGWGVTGQAAGFLVGSILVSLFFLTQVLRDYPGLFGTTQAPHLELDQELSKLRRPFALSNLLGRVSVLSDSMIVAYFLGPTQVATFYVTQRLLSITLTILLSVGNSTWPALAALHLQKRPELFHERFLELSRVLAVLSFVCLGPIVSLNRYFITLWIGPDYYGGDFLTAASALSVSLTALIACWSWMFSATGKASILLNQHIAVTIINVFASVVLTSQVGIVGPVVGTLIGALTVSIWYIPYFLNKHFQVSPREVLGVFFRPVCVLLPAVVVVRYLTIWYLPLSWPYFMGAFFFEAAILCALAWFLVLDPRARTTWIGRFRDLAKSRSFKK